MSHSLIKFMSQTDTDAGNGRGRVWWGRAGVDGAPFRGPQPPMYTQEEYDARVARVCDPHNGTFRTNDEQENAVYLSVLDKIVNQWAKCLYVDRWRDEQSGGQVVYIEWVEYFMEDGQPSQVPGQPLEHSSNGHANG